MNCIADYMNALFQVLLMKSANTTFFNKLIKNIISKQKYRIYEGERKKILPEIFYVWGLSWLDALSTSA